MDSDFIVFRKFPLRLKEQAKEQLIFIKQKNTQEISTNEKEK